MGQLHPASGLMRMPTHLHLKVCPNEILDDIQGGVTEATPMAKTHFVAPRHAIATLNREWLQNKNPSA